MRARRVILSISAVGLLTFGLAAPAQAEVLDQWGEQPTTYCSSSVGYYMDHGRPVHTTYGPRLTLHEQALQRRCYLRLAGTGFAGAGGVMTGNWLAVLGAAFNGGEALEGVCSDFWNATSRFRH